MICEFWHLTKNANVLGSIVRALLTGALRLVERASWRN
jgi:hypothetical protein